MLDLLHWMVQDSVLVLVILSWRIVRCIARLNNQAKLL